MLSGLADVRVKLTGAGPVTRVSMTDISLPLASVTVYTAPTGPVRLFDGFGAAVAGTAVAGAAAGCDWAVATGAEVLAMPPQALTPGNSQRK